MNRQPVESSMLRSVGYDPVESILELEFEDGHLYQYGGVPEEIYREMMDADSKGRYFLTYIQDQYPFARAGEAGQEESSETPMTRPTCCWHPARCMVRR